MLSASLARPSIRPSAAQAGAGGEGDKHALGCTGCVQEGAGGRGDKLDAQCRQGSDDCVPAGVKPGLRRQHPS